VDINVPIGCGGVSVFPDDVVVGDCERVVVTPAEMAADIAEEATRMTRYESFVSERVREGLSIIGLYPPTDPENQIAFEDWKNGEE
jgi:regulator of RNase E activity RraA